MQASFNGNTLLLLVLLLSNQFSSVVVARSHILWRSFPGGITDILCLRLFSLPFAEPYFSETLIWASASWPESLADVFFYFTRSPFRSCMVSRCPLAPAFVKAKKDARIPSRQMTCPLPIQTKERLSPSGYGVHSWIAISPYRSLPVYPCSLVFHFHPPHLFLLLSSQ